MSDLYVPRRFERTRVRIVNVRVWLRDAHHYWRCYRNGEGDLRDFWLCIRGYEV